MCWRGPHAKGLKFPWRDLEQWWCICFVCISMPIVVWYDFEMISRKSTVGARECVSFIHYDITYGKGCIAWNASVHICWSLMLWHIVAMMMIWFFLFFVHAYTSYFFRHNECVCTFKCHLLKIIFSKKKALQSWRVQLVSYYINVPLFWLFEKSKKSRANKKNIYLNIIDN